MIQDVFHINMGYLSFIINVPLIIAAFIVLNREFAVKTTVYIIAFSSAAVLFGELDLSQFLYVSSVSTGLAPIAAGTVRGLLYVATLALNGSAGSIDIVSALIKHKKPHLDIMSVIFLKRDVGR